MAKVLKVRNATNTGWDVVASSIPDVPDISEFLLISSASSTYLTQANASATYLTQSNASNTYLTQSNASNTYATKNELSNIDLSSASAAAVSYLVDSAPTTLDTLNELAQALNDDANFAGTVTAALSNKLNIDTASATYLTQSSASTTYATKTELNQKPSTGKAIAMAIVFGG